MDYGIYYRSWHDESPEHVAEMVDFHRAQIEPLLNGMPRLAALDVGCGMGFAVLALKQMGFQSAIGVDMDEGQVGACRRLGAEATHVTDTAEFLRAHMESFDLVTLLDVLEHVAVEKQVSLMQAILAALRPGGRVIIQVPNANAMLAMRWRYNDFTHHSSFTEHSLRFVMLNAGFKDFHVVPDSKQGRPSLRFWNAGARNSVWRWIFRWLWRKAVVAELGYSKMTRDIPLGLNLLAVAVK